MNKLSLLSFILFLSSVAICQSVLKSVHPVTKDINLGEMVQPIPLKNRFADEKYNIYCGSVTRGKNGKYYMFYSRWPKADGHHAWPFNSEIALAKSETPDGPYQHIKVILPPRGPRFWDGSATHNPHIMQYKGKYYLYYMGTSATSELQRPITMSDKNWWDYRNSQRIGVAVAVDPEGEWERYDKPVLDVSPDPAAYDALMVSNPSATYNEKGEVILVYKQVNKGETYKGGKVTYGVAFAKSPTGPFTKETGRIFELKEGANEWMVAEDPFIWYQQETYFAIVRDVVGKFTGESGAWALLVSDNGKEWSPAKYPKVIESLPVWEDGSKCTGILGRPCLLIENGIPRYLYGAYTYDPVERVSCNIAIPLVTKTIKSEAPAIGTDKSEQLSDDKNLSGQVLIPRISGEWIHVYKPEGDVFPGPDSDRFKTGQFYSDWQVNDHTILKGPDSRWHAFGITHPAIEAGPGVRNAHEAEWFSFHAVSPPGKLKQHVAPYSLKDQPKVLTPADRPGEMKENHSPYIIRHKGEYVMFYGPSPIRYAISKDLITWKPQGALFRQEGSARDPSVMEHNGKFYMAYTTKLSVMVRTSYDLLDWSEPVTVFSLADNETGGPESPTLLAMNGGFYLIWCRWDARLTDFVYQDRSFVYYSNDPLNFHNREPVAEIRGHAPELFQDEEGDWWISSAERPSRGVSIAPVKWKARGSKKQ